MILALAASAIVSGMLAIAADWNGRRHRAFYLLKPLTTVFIIGLALAGEAEAARYQYWIAAALALSLAGDICLMFPGNRWFIGGLGSFLLAHLAFAAAFLLGVGSAEPPGWLAAVLFYGVGLLLVLLPRAGRLKVPVLLYCVVLSAMVFTAAVRHAGIGSPEALRALCGALLFMVSDSLLGWRRFVGEFPHAQALILSTYWTAIGLIAWSV